jgi:hypothetical protein
MWNSMEVSEHELRAMVRDAIARHAGTPAASGASSPALDSRLHASHGLLPLTSGGDADGACLIEPAVRCNHCGFCQSLGH